MNLFSIATGTMISSGFFLLPGIAAKMAGPAVIAAFLLAGLLTIPALLSNAELATAMPRAGGTYFFLDRSMGPLAGTIGGFGSWLSLVLKSGFAMIGFSAYLAALMATFGYHVPITLTAVVLAIALTVLNLAGAKKTGGLQMVLVMSVLALLGIFCGVGVSQIRPTHFTPFLPHGWSSLITTTGFVFISYAGVTKIASVAEEAKDPDKTLPRAMIASLTVVMLLYGVGVAVIVGVVPQATLFKTLTPVSEAARALMGSWGAHLFTIAALLAFVSSANAGLLSASRYPFAMSRDHLLPHWIKKIGKTHAPYNAIILTTAVMLFFILFFEIKEVVKLASAFQLLIFAFINLAVVVMRESEIEDYNPGFRSPAYPWVQIFGILGTLFMIAKLGFIEICFCLGIVVLGGLWYLLYASHKVQRVGAWVWLLQRMAIRLKPNAKLIQELREIQKEKGLKKSDPFEGMVERAPLFELDENENFASFVDKMAEYVKHDLKLDSEAIKKEFLLHDQIGDTPVEAGIALPHIRVSGLEDFFLIFGRSKSGITILENEEPVHAIFALIGAKELSSLHIRILAELAVRADQPNFMASWLKAGDIGKLRKLLLAKVD